MRLHAYVCLSRITLKPSPPPTPPHAQLRLSFFPLQWKYLHELRHMVSAVWHSITNSRDGQRAVHMKQTDKTKQNVANTGEAKSRTRTAKHVNPSLQCLHEIWHIPGGLYDCKCDRLTNKTPCINDTWHFTRIYRLLQFHVDMSPSVIFRQA